jgi:hypothetical protein
MSRVWWPSKQWWGSGQESYRGLDHAARQQRDATTLWRRLEEERDAGTSHTQPSASHAITHRQASTKLLESLALAEAVAGVLRGLQVVAEDTN